MKAVRVAADRWNFELVGAGEFISPVGGNMLNDQHPCNGTLFDHFDAADCDRRLGIMAEAGLNCLRQAIGVNRVYEGGGGLKSEGMRNWDAFIALAEKHGIYLMPVGGYLGGNDWFQREMLADQGRCLDESCAFWEAFVGHYAGHPAIWAWDLRNELLYDLPNVPQLYDAPEFRKSAAEAQRVEVLLKDRWGAYLQARYDSVSNMNRAYGSKYASFEEVPGSVRFVERPFDLCAYDFRRYLNERGFDWCKRQCEVIRRVSPHHMIVSGNNGWLFPDMDLWLANGFHNIALHELFDFVTFHPYPAPQCLPGGHGDPLGDPAAMAFWLNACVGMARIDHYGKPVVMQEFGWYGGGPSRFLCDLPHRSEQEHADYTRKLIGTLIPHVNGFINWPTMDMPTANDTSNHGGIFTHDGGPKALTAVYREIAAQLRGKRLARQAGNATLSYSLLGLYTSRSYQNRMWEEIHQTVAAGKTPDFRFV